MLLIILLYFQSTTGNKYKMFSVQIFTLGLLFIAIRGGFGTHFRGGIMSFKPVGENQVGPLTQIHLELISINLISRLEHNEAY